MVFRPSGKLEDGVSGLENSVVSMLFFILESGVMVPL